MTLTVGSLFSGIGGLDLGLERAGMRVIWQSEIDPYACRVLAKHWPDTPNLGDITRIDWSTVERPDVICGGYPCQPFSYAGARQGEHDRRHLWPYVADALRHLRPRYAVMENVSGHLSLGFGRVLGDMAEIGYDAEWDCIPAAAVGAPHRRDRVFLVAYPNSQSEPGGTVDAAPSRLVVSDTDGDTVRLQPVSVGRGGNQAVTERDGELGDVADADRTGLTFAEGRTTLTERAGWRTPCRRSWWRTEPNVGRVADGVPHRVDRLRALGNAVVPQVAEHIGRMIVAAQ